MTREMQEQLHHWRLKGALALALIAGIFATGLTLACAQRPRRATQSGSIIRVKAGDDLQQAINAAQMGDTIVLDAGATYVGSFSLPYKGAGTGSDADYITIQSSKIESLPADVRVSPQSAPSMARLLTRNFPGKPYGPPAIRTEAAAHHYKLIGLEITSDPAAFIDSLIAFGDGSASQNSLSQVPHHLVVDRCLIDAAPQQPAKRAIALNSSDTQITNSFIAGFKLIGQDSQAIAVWNGPGRFQLINNYLEAAAENILVGGAANSIPGLIPSDIEIKRNTITKPLSWRVGDASYSGTHWEVKNLLEFKTGKRITIEGNVMENSWEDGQEGNAVGFACISNGGDAVPQIEDVVVRYNVVRHAASGVSLYGKWQGMAASHLWRVVIEHNVFEDIDGRWGSNGGMLFIVNEQTDDVRIEHNTAFNTGQAVKSGAGGNTRFVFRNNIVMNNVMSGMPYGDATLRKLFPGSVWTGNVQVGAEASLYASNPRNYFPTTLKKVGFVDPASGDYRLAPNSPYKKAATDGHDIGCDFDALTAALGKSQAGPRTKQAGR